jgi:hypothetical protein
MSMERWISTDLDPVVLADSKVYFYTFVVVLVLPSPNIGSCPHLSSDCKVLFDPDSLGNRNSYKVGRMGGRTGVKS